MSWEIRQEEAVPVEDLERVLHDAIANDVSFAANVDALDEAREQADAGSRAVVELTNAMQADLVSFRMVGHANPGHGPREGYADERVTVEVFRHG